MKESNDNTSQYIGNDPTSFVQQIGGGSDMFPEIDRDMKHIPVLTLKNDVVFPHGIAAVDVTGENNIRLAEQKSQTPDHVFIVLQKSDNDEPASSSELYRVGVLGRIMQHMDTPDGAHHVFVMANTRMQATRYMKTAEGYKANLTPFPYMESKDDVEISAAVHHLIERFIYAMNLREHPQTDRIKESIDNCENILQVVSIIATQMPISDELKQGALEQPGIYETAITLISHAEMVIKLSEVMKGIQERTRCDLSDQQRENYLQAQIRQMQQELGQGADSDIRELEERAAAKKWSDATADHFRRELNKLTRYNVSSPDYSIQYSYLDKMLSLPWNEFSSDDFSVDDVEKTLNRDHFGLDKVKERILEQMAVIKLRNDLHAPILCLVGPPGVGKTSLGKSIADAMGREYQRISFGGMHDEAEIRGHRRTYIGAMPGRIIAALEKCSTSNPVIVLDEIDKIGSDFKGDPSSALLEVLDPEQNSTFHDNYLDTDYDLSHVLFIATANTLSTISAPLLDRMEVISLSGYITAEKVEIAKRHLVPKLLREHGFEEKEIDFMRPALIYMIDRFTRESGVRRLEKVIAKVLRKIARLKVSGKEYPAVVNKKTASELLGKEEFTPDMYEGNDVAGVVTGLAWTSVGGEILFIESSVIPGSDKLRLTGNLGDVMKESASIAVQYLKAHNHLVGMEVEEIAKRDVHIHVPEGAIPKDGPSAGITMVTSVASALTGRKVRSHLAMTGEITLRGKVLPVGGIKEKIIAAKRAGITEIILSAQNRKDIEEINETYIKGLTFTYVDTIEEVLERALV